MVKLGAGDLRDRVHLQARGAADDGFGNTVAGAGDWETRATVWANIRPLVGGTETVLQSRLQGRQPYVMTLRQGSDTRALSPAWQVVDARDATRVFAIAAPPTDPDGRRAWLEVLVIEGGAS